MKLRGSPLLSGQANTESPPVPMTPTSQDEVMGATNAMKELSIKDSKPNQPQTPRKTGQEELSKRLSSPNSTEASRARFMYNQTNYPPSHRKRASGERNSRHSSKDLSSLSVAGSQTATSNNNLPPGKTLDSNSIEKLCSQCGKERGVDSPAPKSEAPVAADPPVTTSGKFKALLGSFLGSGGEGSEKEPHTNETMALREAHKRLDEMGKENRQLLQDIDMLNDELQDIQDTAINATANSSWTPLEDQVIDTILSEIHDDLETWCDGNCAKDFTKLLSLSAEEASEFVNLTGATAYVTNRAEYQIHWWSKQWWTEDGDGGHDLSRILKAILARDMCHTLIENPFVIVDALQHQVREGDSAKKMERTQIYQASFSINRVFKTLEKENPKRSAKFRCGILRTFIQSPETGSKFAELTFTSGIEQTCTSFLTQVCTDLVDQAISRGTAKFMQDPLPDSARSELTELWKRAAHLFIQLHTQMSALWWAGTGRYLGKRFAEHLMTKHNSHPRDVEHHHEIHLMLSPIVVLKGNDDGENYKDYRIVSKGTVLVGPALTA